MDEFKRDYPVFEDWQKLNNPTTAIIAIDTIECFVNIGVLRAQNSEQAVKNMVSVFQKLNAARRIFVRDEHDQQSVEFKFFPPHSQTEEERRIIAELLPFAHEIVGKNSTNAVFRLMELDLSSIKTVVLFGFATDMCVLQAALGLRAYFNEYNLDKDIILFENCCGTFSAPAELLHNAALRIMNDQGIAVRRV